MNQLFCRLVAVGIVTFGRTAEVAVVGGLLWMLLMTVL
jgi:hypothetical protein